MKERGIADEVIKRFIKEKVIKFLISIWGRVHLHVKKKKTPKTQMQCPKKKIALKMKCLIIEYIIVEICIL